ncbi:permease for cytosine/purines, uracil, thiamine, allantoin-domain-containing protein [Desarmillaria tabescens]|uniref:Permease for cytosine/purines, uracil, thiamine, allantoin-domain-containing protein n=1 Tax=Armillaria tabescens TaxID=1929756 RepID=A0AA39TYI5_ARMTA|nr:permease for cytosine/purines, uracil, thiamine, allantoin-domain-containing protein [Desarmillaria tabescens]KAK0463125.1 permease for cytosine/purines, uracil, thiamine, allantoin-domain-containing protein [Desarmillaria tabescens]
MWYKPSHWALESAASSLAPPGKERWSNKDMDPVPPHLRTWSTRNYVAYWISDATNTAVWELASSMLAVGLSWRQALPAIAVGHVIIAIVTVLNGTIGARLHIAVSSYFSVVSRVILAMFWYWDTDFPFMLVSPQKIRHLFMAKAFIVPCAWLAILIWAMVKAPPSHAEVSGSALSWAWLSALNSALGIYATLAVNVSDFTSQYVQLFIIPTVFTLIGFVGIAVTSAGEVLYGETLWDPLKLIDKWDNRAAAFFAAFSFFIATLGTNISANSLSAANDMTVLFPRYINIRRGQVICAILGGWALCPWEILASAPGFLTFMNGMYWFVHKCKVDLRAMYDPHGRYRYWNGINWRAVVALLCAVPPSFPGLIYSVNPSIYPGKVSHVFDIAWLYGFFTASTVYWTLSKIFPPLETFVEEDHENLDVSATASLDLKNGTGDEKVGVSSVSHV